MEESYEDAIRELKRADHLIFVSLKYTRTVDIFKSIIERLLATFNHTILWMLEQAKEEQKIQAIPQSPGLQCNLIKGVYKEDEKLLEYLAFYLYLRKLDKATYTPKNEFRRHVTMMAVLESNEVTDITMEDMHEYFKKTKEYFEYITEHYKKKEGQE